MPQTVDLAYLSIAEAGVLFRRRELSPVELVNALLERSERLQETLVPYVTLTPELTDKLLADTLAPLRMKGHALSLLDQRRLPTEEIWIDYTDYRR